MGEPVDEVLEGSIETAMGVLDRNVRELEQDIEYFSGFQDSLDEFEPAGMNNDPAGIISDNSDSDTDRVLELYDKHVLSNQEIADQVKVYSEKFGLSLEAADLMDELLGIKNYSRQDIKTKIEFIDGSNPMTPGHVEQFYRAARLPKEARRQTIEETEDEIDRLDEYRRRLTEMEEELLELNREYKLPMELDEAIEVVEELDTLREGVQQLRAEREDDLRNRSDERGEYFERNLELFYEDESVETPVLDDLDSLESAVEESYDNLAIEY